MAKEAPPVRLDDALDRVGFGRSQIEILIVCSAIMMTIVTETMGMSIILPAAKCDLKLGSADQGLLQGATFLGIVMVSYVCGYLSDTRGRRKIMMYSLYATSVCALASSVANSTVLLLVLRLLAGICISAPSATVFAYLGEFCPPVKRSQIISFGSVWGMLAMVYVALFGWWVLSYNWVREISTEYSFKPWRLLFLVYNLPGLLSAIALSWLPESPKFYYSAGQTGKALAVLKHCYRRNKGTDIGFLVEKLEPESIQTAQKKGIFASLWSQTVPLLKWPMVLYFSAVCLQQISAFAAYGGLGLWYPELMNQLTNAETELTVCAAVEESFAKKNLMNSTTTEVCSSVIHQSTFIYLMIMGLFGTCCALLSALLLGKFNPKMLGRVNFLLAAISGILLQFTSNRYLIIALFCCEIILAGYCMVLINMCSVAIFPTQVRAMAVSLSLMMARLSSFTFSSIVGFVMEENCAATFYMFSSILAIGVLLSFLLPK
ncbi:synaptic vesicle glycoprotein 2B-like [Uranotaenia lowii]|uniref:synaptic vesicle glycoprotein 2B-like n=1 Tax=Uranotaenia lowii TaxID=190385 RepID=UPI00247946A7|nr:synaptic vesicle glycoprotein 2B-like [Uranotaenia lowii]